MIMHSSVRVRSRFSLGGTLSLRQAHCGGAHVACIERLLGSAAARRSFLRLRYGKRLPYGHGSSDRLILASSYVERMMGLMEQMAVLGLTCCFVLDLLLGFVVLASSSYGSYVRS